MGYELGRLPSLMLTMGTQNVFSCAIFRRFYQLSMKDNQEGQKCAICCVALVPPCHSGYVRVHS